MKVLGEHASFRVAVPDEDGGSGGTPIAPTLGSPPAHTSPNI